MCACVCVCVCVCARALAHGSITYFEKTHFRRNFYEHHFRVLKYGMSMENGLNTTKTKAMILFTVNNMIPVENVPYISVSL